MWLPLALCVLLEFAEIVSASGGLDDALEVTFSERTRADWEKVWHQESHSRCREKLIRHLYWACEKDIYRISKRGGRGDDSMVGLGTEKRPQSAGQNLLEDTAIQFPWAIDREVAYAFLRTRRNGKRRSGGSITAECCTRTGCTWEEYAEYCPSNKRLNQYRRRK
ncbi:probable insulin-like peptide 7 [Anopheles stephensi]|uniref:Inuslin-like peptide 5 n=1 Tax=Anopheles stephensi TaxID=30069 RepID=G0WJX2_ANOST|nr:probable insulin-like peptide 7 [Anopheles stephensi]AEA51307.1 inuslin-like peptide 5 precursor [Anopheles stephensi]